VVVVSGTKVQTNGIQIRTNQPRNRNFNHGRLRRALSIIELSIDLLDAQYYAFKLGITVDAVLRYGEQHGPTPQPLRAPALAVTWLANRALTPKQLGIDDRREVTATNAERPLLADSRHS
jgi:hypothetical protein